MLCVLCLIVLWGFSLVTSYSGVKYDVPEERCIYIIVAETLDIRL